VEDLEIKPDSRFDFQPTSLDGLFVVRRKPLGDPRGFLCRLFCAEEFQAAGLKKPVVQINHTYTAKKGSIRGLHFQYPPHTECKLVSCLRGEVYDVALDLRKGSPTFLRWHGEVLSADNQKSLLIPEGFAHGFQALADDCELLYLHTAPFREGSEGAIHYADPRAGLAWLIPVTDVSERDSRHPFMDLHFQGIDV
jgi:dTDP-4-dehydrorhamnose 3,5-epimerase